MATRYFKKPDEREVCTTSSGNRSKVQPDAPGYPYDWIEIERKEFVKLRCKIVSGRTLRGSDVASLCDCGEPFPESGRCKFCGAVANSPRRTR